MCPLGSTGSCAWRWYLRVERMAGDEGALLYQGVQLRGEAQSVFTQRVPAELQATLAILHPLHLTQSQVCLELTTHLLHAVREQ